LLLIESIWGDRLIPRLLDKVANDENNVPIERLSAAFAMHRDFQKSAPSELLERDFTAIILN
jgi:hypothetical protein